MTARSLEKIFYRQPFKPFRLTLANGEEVLVCRPRKSMVSGDQIAVVGICRRNGGVGVEKLRITYLDRVLAAEDAPQR